MKLHSKLNHISSTILILASPYLINQLSAEPSKSSAFSKYVTPVPVPNSRIWHITHNLGPTGARGWIGNLGDLESNSEKNQEILIKSIEANSPADGILQRYDVIISIKDPGKGAPHTWTKTPVLKRLGNDARYAFARAITWAESDAGGGKLELGIVRNGKKMKKVLLLNKLGTFADTIPLHCPKSQKLALNAAEFIVKTSPIQGYPKGVGEPLAPLHLIATGKPEFRNIARRSALNMLDSKYFSPTGKASWSWGYTTIFLCEYYLATGDDRVLPAIKSYTKCIANGQFDPGVWGHTVVKDFVSPGYGAVNATGVTCFLALAYADHIGLQEELIHDINEKNTLLNSVKFFGDFAGTGGPGYGDHPPYLTATSAGKNGVLAYAFNLLGSEPTSNWFAHLSASANYSEYESGHCGNFFNQVWTPIGSGLAGEENYKDFWTKFHSFRDLNRRHDGSFITNPEDHWREGDLGWINYVKRGPHWSTGGFALPYLIGNKQTFLTGRKDSVFRFNAPAELKPALREYRQKDFKKASKLATELMSSPDSRTKKLAAQLNDLCLSNIKEQEITIKELDKSLNTKDYATIKYTLDAAMAVFKESDPRITKFTGIVKSVAKENISAGKSMHNTFRDIEYTGQKGYGFVAAPGQIKNKMGSKTISKFLDDKNEYSETAKALYTEIPILPLTAKESVLKVKKSKSVDWKILSGFNSLPRSWNAPDFNDKSWESVKIPTKGLGKQHLLRTTFQLTQLEDIDHLSLAQDTEGRMQVFLNGEMIIYIDQDRSRGRPRRDIILKETTKELLRKGTNTLAVIIDNTKSRSKTNQFNLDLKVARKRN